MVYIFSFACQVLNDSFSTRKYKLICLALYKSSKLDNCRPLKFETLSGTINQPCEVVNVAGSHLVVTNFYVRVHMNVVLRSTMNRNDGTEN